MPHFFEKRDPWGHGLGLWVLVFMAFTLPLAVWGVSHLHTENHAEQWLSDDSLQTRQFTWYRSIFSVDDGLLLSWDGSALEDPRVNRLVTRLAGVPDASGVRRGGLKEVASVRSPNQIIQRMVESKIDREEAVRRITGALAGPGRVWCNFSTTALNQKSKSLRTLNEAVRERFGIKLTVIEPVIDGLGNEGDGDQASNDLSSGESETAVAAPAGNTAVVESGDSEAAAAVSEQSDQAPQESVSVAEVEPAPQHDIELSWPNMHADSQQISELMTFIQEIKIPVVGENATEPLLAECYLHRGQPIVLAIALSEAGRASRHQAIAEIRRVAVETGIADSALHLVGAAVATDELNQAVAKAIWNTNAPWYRPHERSIVFLSWLAALAVTCWLLNDTRLSIIVLAVSCYASLVTVALMTVWGGSMTLLLITIPTLILVSTSSGAIHLNRCWRAEVRRDPNGSFARAIVAARGPILLAGVATAVGAGSLMTSQFAPLRAFGFYSAVGVLLSAGSVLYAVPALLQAWPITPARTDHVASTWTYLGRVVVRRAQWIAIPSLLLAAVATFGIRYSEADPRVARCFPEQSPLIRDSRNLEEYTAGVTSIETVVSFGKIAQEETSFSQRMETVRAITDKLRELPEVSGAISLADFQPVSESLDPKASAKKILAHNARARTIEAQLKKTPEFKSMFAVTPRDTEFSAAGDELWRITSQVAAMSDLKYRDLTLELDQACRTVMKYHSDTRNVVTGIAPAFLSTQKVAMDTLSSCLFVAVILAAVAMIAVSHSLPAGILSAIVNVLPSGVILGVLAWRRIPFDVGTLIATCIALWITLSSTLRAVACYRNGVINGLSHRRAVVRSLEQCGPLVVQTHLAFGLAALVLVSADLLIFSRSGGVMSMMLMTGLVTEIVLTPAMLAGPVGWFIFGAAMKQRSRLKTVTADPESGAPLRHEPHRNPPKPQYADEPRDGRSHRFDEGKADGRKKRR